MVVLRLVVPALQQRGYRFTTLDGLQAKMLWR
jgi:hypothetical protein